MFTGIIEEVGTVARLDSRATGARIEIRAQVILSDLEPGASIAVNGVCLTAAAIDAGSFTADVSPETLKRSNLGDLRTGSMVNLERPLAPSGRLGGHLVQGHIDGTGEFLAVDELGGGNWWLKVRIPEPLVRYVVEKGSIAIDGISLTVAEIRGEEMAAAIIPHTYRHTALKVRRAGDRVNIECDILAKYVEKLLGSQAGKADGLSVEKLRGLGY